MNAQQKLKHMILLRHADSSNYDFFLPDEAITSENVDRIYEEAYDDSANDGLQDAREEIRGGEAETGISCGYSRHYELKSVAARYLDGSWVGWTYIYGGGKHAEPEAEEWIEYAYDLNVTEEEKLVVVRTFAKVPA